MTEEFSNYFSFFFVTFDGLFLAVRIWVLRVKIFVFFSFLLIFWLLDPDPDLGCKNVSDPDSKQCFFVYFGSSQLIFFISERHRVHFEILHRELHTRFSCTPYTKTKNLRKIIKNAHTCTLKAAGNLIIFFNDKL